jgi:hypothetical protein
MRGLRALLAGSLLVAAMTFGIPGVALAQAGPKCTLSTLDGLYVFTATGWGIGVVPKAIIELIRFNGDGSVDVPGGTLSVNGGATIRQNLSSTGSYTVADADGVCAGSLTFVDGIQFDLFFSRKGEDISMIQTNLNNVFRGTATRVSH